MTMNQYTDKEMEKRLHHFRRVIRYRSLFGWVFTGAGLGMFLFGLKNLANPLILINGVLFFAYGLFMVWQTKKAKAKLEGNG